MKTKFKVGDIVAFLFGPTPVEGEIVEDRGNLGVGGERIYDIVVPFLYADSMHFEKRESHLTLIRRKEEPIPV